MTFTAWVEFPTFRDDGRRNIYLPMFIENLSKTTTYYKLYDILSAGRCLSGVFVITRLKAILFTNLTTQNTTESNCIMSHAQNTTEVQPNVFLT